MPLKIQRSVYVFTFKMERTDYLKCKYEKLKKLPVSCIVVFHIMISIATFYS